MKLAIIPAVIATFVAAAPVAAQVTPVYNYNLNGTLANQGSGTGTLVDNGATLDATGLTFPQNGGPTLTGATPLTAYTIDLVFRLDAISGYRKLVDFSGRAADSGLYAQSGFLNFFNATGDTGASFGAGDDVRVTFSRAATGIATGYLNGAQSFSFNDVGGLALFGSTIEFFRDDFATGQREASSGFVDYIRVFDQVLTPAQAIVPAAPTGAVPEPATWAMMLLGFGGMGYAMRRRRTVMHARFAGA